MTDIDLTHLAADHDGSQPLRLDDEITGNFEVLQAVTAGQFTIWGCSPGEMHWQDCVCDPTRLAPDMERSVDPVLAFRPHGYAISAKRRLSR